MIMPSDEDYQLTKRLKRSGEPLESPFKELADWISSNYRVHVLNVVYDTIVVARRNFLRLSIVLEMQADALKFRESAWGNFHEADQRRVRDQFETILSQQRCHRFNAEGLFVIFEAFEPVARIEANLRVGQDEIDQTPGEVEQQRLVADPHIF